jgi:DNA-binding IclR family transcriptional regulator
VPNAVDRVSKAIEAIAKSGQASSATLVTELGMSRQAVSRLLDSLEDSGLVVRDSETKRYSLGLWAYSWGSQAVQAYLPSATTRLEVARLASEFPYSVLYVTRQGEWAYTIERTQAQGGLMVTKPTAGRNHWSETTTGRVTVAFAEPSERKRLLARLPSAETAETSALLDEIAEQGFGERSTTPTRHTLAAPILDDQGFALAALAIVVTNYDPSQREQILTALRDTASRSAADLSHDLLAAVL